MESGENQTSHYVKRVLLPSGKASEVVYYKDPVEESSGLRPSVEPARDLHVCMQCHSELVYPTGWDEASETSWNVVLRCPECELIREGVFSQDAVEAFDERLDSGTDALMADYRQLVRANMEEEADRFASALDCGAVLPEDF